MTLSCFSSPNPLAVSGISIPSEVPPKSPAATQEPQDTSKSQLLPLSSALCGEHCRKESCREGKRLNLEVSALSPPSNQQSPSESRRALPALVVASEDKDMGMTVLIPATHLPDQNTDPGAAGAV